SVSPCAMPAKYGLASESTCRHDQILCSLHPRQRRGQTNQSRLYTGQEIGDSTCGAVQLSPGNLSNCATQLSCVVEVDCFDRRNRSAEDITRVSLAAQSNPSQDRQL